MMFVLRESRSSVRVCCTAFSFQADKAFYSAIKYAKIIAHAAVPGCMVASYALRGVRT